jgi:hypothetical protein
MLKSQAIRLPLGCPQQLTLCIFSYTPYPGEIASISNLRICYAMTRNPFNMEESVQKSTP